MIGVCQVIPRGIASPQALSFLQQSTVLNQYVSVVLEQFTNVFCWSHADFNSPLKDFYVADGVHLNPSGPVFALPQLPRRCSQSGEHVVGTKLILVRFPHFPFWVYFVKFWLVICSYTSLLMHG